MVSGWDLARPFMNEQKQLFDQPKFEPWLLKQQGSKSSAKTQKYNHKFWFDNAVMMTKTRPPQFEP